VIARGQEHDHSYDKLAFSPGQNPIEAVKENHVTRDEDGWHFRNKYMQKPPA